MCLFPPEAWNSTPLGGVQSGQFVGTSGYPSSTHKTFCKEFVTIFVSAGNRSSLLGLFPNADSSRIQRQGLYWWRLYKGSSLWTFMGAVQESNVPKHRMSPVEAVGVQTTSFIWPWRTPCACTMSWKTYTWLLRTLWFPLFLTGPTTPFMPHLACTLTLDSAQDLAKYMSWLDQNDAKSQIRPCAPLYHIILLPKANDEPRFLLSSSWAPCQLSALSFNVACSSVDRFSTTRMFCYFRVPIK